MKLSQLIDMLQDDLSAYGDVEVLFPDHTRVMGTQGAQDGDREDKPLVVFLLDEQDVL